MRIIGITGGIGSGKTTVSKYIKNLGYEVIDADLIAHGLADDKGVLSEIEDMFGPEVITPEGTLDRKRMAAVVFSNAEKKELLENIITSRVVMECEKRIAALRAYGNDTGKDIAFLDAPLLFETGSDRLVDEIWVITCDMKDRVDRAELRDGSTAEEIEARIAAQMPEDEMAERADELIVNDGTLEDLYAKVDQLLK